MNEDLEMVHALSLLPSPSHSNFDFARPIFCKVDRA